MKGLVPVFILRKFSEKSYSGILQAYAMFIDISGFTNMTQQLMKNGKEGAEILSEIINNIFTPSIEIIHHNGGFISSFAGDAFTAIFDCDTPLNIIDSAIKIREIFRLYGEQQTKFGIFSLGVKIGLSYGTVEWSIIKNDVQNSFYFRGAAIDRCAENEHYASNGMIIMDKTIFYPSSEITMDYTPHTNGLFLLKNCETHLQEYPFSPNNYPIDSFVPEPIIKMQQKGEFREIISCFISFKETNDFQDRLNDVIALTGKFGGYFNKIDFGDKGGVILVIFGAPTAQENIFVRACDFALSVKMINDFHIRIGLTNGVVFTGFMGSDLRCEYTALGMVVNLSARYMMSAKYGEIYIDKPIQRNIFNHYETEWLGDNLYKGFKDKIAVYKLIKKNYKHLERTFTGKMVGRKDELLHLTNKAKVIFDPNPRYSGIIYIDGPAGIGKSRLIETYKQKCLSSKNKVRWFFLSCDEVLKKSFNPVIYMLRDYFEQSEDFTMGENRANFEEKYYYLLRNQHNEEISVELQRTKSFIGALLDLHWENSLYEELDGKLRYENTLYALKNFIKAECSIQPVIMEIDDAHWIDLDSKKWVEILTGNIKEYPLAILAACRYQDDGTTFRFDTYDQNKESIQILNFDKPLALEFIRNNLKSIFQVEIKKISEPLFELIWNKSEGNPFYIEQIVLYLSENKLITEQGNLISEKIEIPSKISSIIISRLDRLTEDVKETIRMASVLGKEFYLNILSVMLSSLKSDYSGEKFERVITIGEEQDIWNAAQEMKYIFKHALIRESVYEIQLKQRLRELHALAADTIQVVYKKTLDSHLDDLAYHYERANIYEKAIYFLDKAGKFAKHNFRNRKALELFNRKIDLIDGKYAIKEISESNISGILQNAIFDYIDTLIEKKYLLQTLGNLTEAEKTVILAYKLSKMIKNDDRIAKSALDMANIYKIKGNFQKSIKYLNTSLELFQKTDEKLMLGLTYLDMGIANFWLGNQELAFDYFNKELEIFVEINDRARISEAYGNLGVIYRYLGNFKTAMDFLKKQLEIAQDLNEKIQIARTFSNIGWVYEATKQYDNAITYYKDSLKLNQKLGLKLEIIRILDNLGYVFQLQNKAEQAIDYHLEALHIARETNDKESIANIFANLGHAYKALKDNTIALKYYDKGIEICMNNSYSHYLPELYIEKGEILIVSDISAGESLIKEGINIAKKVGIQNYVDKGNELLKMKK